MNFGEMEIQVREREKKTYFRIPIVESCLLVILTKGLAKPEFLFETSFHCCCSQQRPWTSPTARVSMLLAAPARSHPCAAILKEMRKWKFIHIATSRGRSYCSNNAQTVPGVRCTPSSLARFEVIIRVSVFWEASWGRE